MLIGILLTILLLFLPLNMSNEALLPPQIVLTLLLVGGVAALLLLLSGVSLLLSWQKLSDRTQALGLPPGSVRALIALLLVLIFPILALHTFALINCEENTLNNLTQAQLDTLMETRSDDLISVQALPDSERFTVRLRQRPDAAAVDLSQQILTVTGTLVTAVAAFYFGAQSIQKGRGASSKSEPIIYGFKGGANVGTAGTTTTATLVGENFQQPSVTFSSGDKTLRATLALWSNVEIQCALDLKEAAADTYIVTVTNSDGGVDRFTGFVVQAAPS
jgi:hypothetical protein